MRESTDVPLGNELLFIWSNKQPITTTTKTRLARDSGRTVVSALLMRRVPFILYSLIPAGRTVSYAGHCFTYVRFSYSNHSRRLIHPLIELSLKLKKNIHWFIEWNVLIYICQIKAVPVNINKNIWNKHTGEMQKKKNGPFGSMCWFDCALRMYVTCVRNIIRYIRWCIMPISLYVEEIYPMRAYGQHLEGVHSTQ